MADPPNERHPVPEPTPPPVARRKPLRAKRLEPAPGPVEPKADNLTELIGEVRAGREAEKRGESGQAPSSRSPPPWPSPAGWWLFAAFVCGVVCAATAHEPPSGTVALNYLALVGGMACVTFSILRRWPAWPRRPVLSACIACSFLVLVLYARADYYTTEWAKLTDPKTGKTWQVQRYPLHEMLGKELRCGGFEDTYRRWGRVHIYRSYSSYEPGEYPEGNGFRTKGPMSPSGKPHGEWEWYSCDQKRLGQDEFDRYKSGRTWYWYGDKITEGEWHLRNR